MRTRHRSRLEFLLATAPAVIAITVVLWVPISQVIVLSFTDYDGFTGGADPVGFDNYVRAFTDPAVAEATGHTLVYAFFYVVVQLIVAFAIALGVTRVLRGSSFYRSIFFIPGVLSPVAVVFAWSFLYDPEGGAINTMLRAVGLGSWAQDWLGSFDLALYSVIAVDLWRTIGFYVVIFVAGLATIPLEPQEAATVDGANAWQILWHVTIPQLRVTIGLAVILALNGAFRAFDTVFLLTRGGPGRATELYMTKTFGEAFTRQNFGYGAALAVLILLVLLILSALQRRATAEGSQS